MVNFELSKEIKEDVFCLVTSIGQRKKILSPDEESNLRPSDSVLQCSTTEPQRLHNEGGLSQIFFIVSRVSSQ